MSISRAPGGARTPNPLLRRQMLYPVELRARAADFTRGFVAVVNRIESSQDFAKPQNSGLY